MPMTLYDYTAYKNVMVCGDIHGHFEVVYGNPYAENTLFIVAGDCGFGFQPLNYYDQLYSSQMSRFLRKKGNTILFIRGNHDNPAIFDGETFVKKYAVCIPDYSVVRTANHNILCIGGGISIDRLNRKEQMERTQNKLYWKCEAPVFEAKKIKEIKKAKIKLDTVITHTAPSFCPPQTNIGIAEWLRKDPDLETDLANERKTMDAIWQELKHQGYTIRQWWYAHFHRSTWIQLYDCYFRMLDIDETDHLKDF